jgi:hypothetical protein
MARATIIMGALVSAEALAAPTTVTLGFDGAYLDDPAANADDAGVQQMLASRGLHASFFVNSALVGTNGHLTLSQLLSLQKDGNEIGGSTATHVDLLTLDSKEQAREICVDRSWLLGEGLQIRSFAFPPSLGDPLASGAVDLVVQCGYGAARGTGGLGCSGCPAGLSLPPPDPLRVATLPAVASTTTLGDLEGYVNAVVQSPDGGWLIVVIDHLCEGCDALAVSPKTLGDFLDWLVAQQPQGVSVRTVGEVIGQPLKPAVAGPGPTPPGTDGNLLQNGSLEQDTLGTGIPDCWEEDGKPTNLFVFTRVNDAHDGEFAEQIQISDYTSGNRRLLVKQDLGSCAPAAATGHQYRLTAWVKPEGVVKFVAYVRDGSGAWSYLGGSPALSTSSDYQLAQWITPAMPSVALGLSVGVSLESRGSVTVDDVHVEDLGVPAGGGCTTAPGANTDVGWFIAAWIALLLRRVGERGRIRAKRTFMTRKVRLILQQVRNKLAQICAAN